MIFLVKTNFHSLSGNSDGFLPYKRGGFSPVNSSSNGNQMIVLYF